MRPSPVKLLYDTASKQVTTNPLDDPGERASDNLLPINDESTPYRDLDLKYHGDLDPDLVGDYKIRQPEQQGTGAKVLRTIGRGIIGAGTGLLDTAGAIQRTVTPLGTFGDILEATDNATLDYLGKSLKDYDEYLKNAPDHLKEKALDAESLQVYEKELSEDPTFSESALRYSTAESIISSAIEFGVTGLGVGAAVKGAGMAMLSVSGNLMRTASAANKVNKFGQGLGQVGRVLANDQAVLGAGKVLGKIKPSVVVSAALNNSLESRVMANELEKELMLTYRGALENPDTPQSVKDDIIGAIQAQKTNMYFLNATMMASDMFGFSRIFNKIGVGASGAKPTLMKHLMKDLSILAPWEGAEEIIQSVMQNELRFAAMEGVEERTQDSPEYAGFKDTRAIFPYTGEGADDYKKNVEAEFPLLYKTNPEEAVKAYERSMMGMARGIYEHGTSAAAWTEGVAGLLGGGPQWMITRSAGAKGRWKRIQDEYATSQVLSNESTNVLNSLVKEDFRKEASLNSVIETLESLHETLPASFVKSSYYEDYKGAVRDYSAASIAIRALQKGAMDSTVIYLDEAKKSVEADLKSGEITQAEADISLSTIAKTKEKLEQYKPLLGFFNSSELLAAHLELEAISQAAEIDRSIENMRSARRPARLPGEKQAPLIRLINSDTKQPFTEDKLENAIASFISRFNGTGVQDVADAISSLKSIGNVEVEAVNPKDSYGHVIYNNLKGKTTQEMKDSLRAMLGVDVVQEEKVTAATTAGEKTEATTPVESKSVADIELKKTPGGTVPEMSAEASTAPVANDLGKISEKLKRVRGEKFFNTILKRTSELKSNIATLKTGAAQDMARRSLEVSKDIVRTANTMANSTNKAVIDSKINYLLTAVIPFTSGNLRAQAQKAVSLGYSKIKVLDDVNKKGGKATSLKDKADTVKVLKEKKPRKLKVDPATDTTEVGSKITEQNNKEVSEQAAEELVVDKEKDNKTNSDRQKIVDETVKAVLNQETSTETPTEEKTEGESEADEFFSDNARLPSKKLAANLTQVAEVTVKQREIDPREVTGILGEVVKLIEALQATAARLGIPNYTPNRNDIASAIEGIFKVPVTGEMERVLTAVMNLYKPQEEETTSRAAKEQTEPDMEDELYDITGFEVDPVYTTGSIDEAHNSIAWNDVAEKDLKDFTAFKEGSKITFKVLNDIEAKDIPVTVVFEDFSIPSSSGKGITVSTTVPWSEFLKGLDKNGYYKGNKHLTVSSTRPIQILSKGMPYPLGYVHTSAWAQSERRPLDPEKREEVSAKIVKFRDMIYKESKFENKKSTTLPGVIEGRKSNIKSIGTDSFIGVALNRSKIRSTKTSEVVGTDRTVKFGIVGDDGKIISPPNGKIVMHKGRTKKGLAVFPPGSIVMMVPLENTNTYAAQRLGVRRTTPDEFLALENFFFGDLLSEKSAGRLIEMTQGIGTATEMSRQPTPVALKQLVDRFINTYPASSKIKAKNLRITLVADDAANTLKAEFIIGTKVYAITYEYTINEAKTAKFYRIKQIQNPNGRGFISDIQVKNLSRTHLSYTTLEDVVKGVEEVKRAGLLPYINIDNNGIANSQAAGGPKNSMIASVKEINGRMMLIGTVGDYLTEHVLPNTYTNMAKPTKISDGTRVYTTNTVITVGFEDTDVNSEIADHIKEEAKKQEAKSEVLPEEENLEVSTTQMKEVESSTANILSNLKTKRTAIAPEQLVPKMVATLRTLVLKFPELLPSNKKKEFNESLSFAAQALNSKSVDIIIDNFESIHKRALTLHKKYGKALTDLRNSTARMPGKKKESKDTSLDFLNDMEAFLADVPVDPAIYVAPVVPEEQKSTKPGKKVIVDKKSEATTKLAPTYMARLGKKILSKFTLVYLNKAKTVTSSGEVEASMISGIANITKEKIVYLKKPTIGKDDEAILKSEVKWAFIEYVKKARQALDAYSKDKNVERSEKDLIKLEALGKFYDNIYADPDSKLSQKLIDSGFYKGLYEVGYNVKAKTVELQFEDSETPNEDSEDYTDQEQETSHENAGYGMKNIEKDPKKSLNTALKARLSLLQDYEMEYEPNMRLYYPEPKITVAGSPVYKNNVYIKLLRLFADTLTYSWEEKLDILEKKVKEIKANPKLYITEFYLVDLYDQLTGKSTNKIANYTDEDINSLNRALNLTEANHTNISISSNGVLQETDVVFTSAFSKMMASLRTNLNEIVRKKEDNYEKFKALLTSQSKESILEDIGGRFDQVSEKLQEGTLNPKKFTKEYLNKQRLQDVAVLLQSLVKERIYIEVNPQTADADNKILDDLINILALHVADKFIEISTILGKNLDSSAQLGIADALKSNLQVKSSVVRGSDTSGKNIGLIDVFTRTIEYFTGYVVDDKRTSHRTALTSLYRWIAVNYNNDEILDSVTKIGSKSLGNYMPPSKIDQAYKRFRDSKFVQEKMKDIFAKTSRVLSIVQNTANSSVEWISTVYDKLKGIGLQSSYKANIDKPDGAFEHAFHNFTSYLVSLDLLDPNSLGTGTAFDLIEDTVTTGGKTFTHSLLGRAATFPLLAFSDKDTLKKVTGIDFSASVVKGNTVSIQEEYVDYFMDAIVLPELVRMVEYNTATAEEKAKFNLSGYNPNIFFSIPALNKDFSLQKLALQLKGVTHIGSFKSSFKDKTQNELWKHIRDIVKPATKTNLQKAIDDYLTHLEKAQIITKSPLGYYQLHENLELIKQFEVLGFELEGKAFRDKDPEEIEAMLRSLDSEKFLSLIGNYVFSNMINNFNQYQLFTGDMAQSYMQASVNRGKALTDKDYDFAADIEATYMNNGKRLTAMVSPAEFADSDQEFIWLEIQDIKKPSNFYNGQRTKEGKQYKSIGSPKATDGAAGSTIKAELQWKVLLAEFTKAEAELVEKYWRGTITGQELIAKLKEKGIAPKSLNKYAANITKPRFVDDMQVPLKFGPQGEVQSTVQTLQFVKIGQTTLSPSLVGTNTNSTGAKLLGISEELEKATGKPVRFTFTTGTKQGNVKEALNLDDVAYDTTTKTWVVVKDGQNQLIQDTGHYRAVSYNGYGLQVRTNVKKHEQITTPGQQQDILLSAAPEALRKKFLAVKSRLDYIGMQTVKYLFRDTEKANVSIEDLISQVPQIRPALEAVGANTSNKNLARILREMLQMRESVDLAYIDPAKVAWLDLDENGKFKLPVAESPSFESFTDAIRTTIEKKSVKQKQEGISKALIPSEFLDLSDAGLKSSGIVMLNGATEKLHTDPKTGNRSLKPQVGTAPAQLLIGFSYTTVEGKTLNMKDFLTVIDGRTVIDTTRLPAEILEIIGYRTPTQDYGFITYAEVVGFLPEAWGNAVAAPMEFVSLMGSDFDIDKLFGYKYNLKEEVKEGLRYVSTIKAEDVYVNGKKPTDLSTVKPADIKNPELERYYLENEIIRTSKEILSDPDIVFEEIIGDSDNVQKVLFDIADDMDAAKGIVKDPNTSFLFPSYQETKRNQAAQAESTIGVFAKLARIYSQFREKSVPWLKKTKDQNDNTIWEPITLKLGSLSISYVAGKRPSIFKPADPDKPADSFYKTKNSISGGITTGVDNEKLQVAHRLNFKDKTYDTVSALLLFGFSLKTATAIANMPKFDDNIEKDYLKALKNKYEQETGVNLDSAGEENKIKEFLKPEKFTLLMPKKNQLIDEDSFYKDLNRLNTSVRRMLNGGPIIKIDVENYIRLMKFITSLNEAYTTTISPIGKLVNADSKGIPRNLYALDNLISRISSTDFDSYWKHFRKLETIYGNAQIIRAYGLILNNLMEQTEAVKSAVEIARQLGQEFGSLYPVHNAYRIKKYSRFAPNLYSLKSRLYALRNSTDPIARQIVDNNPFISRLTIGDTTIDFMSSTELSPKDITDGIEILSEYGDIDGIDMKLLKMDLIHYALASSGQKFPKSFLRFIHPKHYLDKQNTNITQDPYELLAFVYYENLPLLKGRGRPDPEAVVAGTPYFWSESLSGTDGTKYVTVHWITTGGVHGSMDPTDYAEYTHVNELNTTRNFVNPMNDTPVVEVKGDRAAMSGARVYAFIERAFSRGSQKILKEWIKGIYPEGLTFDPYTEDSQFESDTNTLKIDRRRVGTFQTVPTFIHEVGHSVLLKLERLYQGGNLLTQFTKSNVFIGQELEKVFDNLSKAKDSVTDYIITQVLDPYIHGKLVQDSLKGAYVIDNILEVASGSLATEAEETAFREAIMPGAPTAHNAVMYALMQKRYGMDRIDIGGEVTYRLYFMTVPEAGKKAVKKYTANIDPKFKELLDYLSNTFLGTATQEQRDIAIPAISRFNSDIASKDEDIDAMHFDYIYGLSNLSEFMSQTYSMSSGETERGYMSGYLSAIRGMGAPYAPVYQSNYTAYKGLGKALFNIYNKAIQLLRQIVNLVANQEIENALFGDFVYAQTLARSAAFINPVYKGSATSDWVPTELTEKIIPCK